MNKFSVIASILFLTCSMSPEAYAQDTDPFSYNANMIPSAESYNMAKYGNARPSLYTGAMSYSVPIYTYEDEDFTIPVSLDYVFNGYRPSQHSGTVGLGWSLNCGGVVTREVVGIPDDYQRSHLDDIALVNKYGFYHLATRTSTALMRQKLANGTFDYISDNGAPYYYGALYPFVYSSPGSDNGIYFHGMAMVSSSPIQYASEYGLDIGDLYDNASDIYHFNFLGYSGDFVIMPSGECLVYNSSSPAGEFDITLNFNGGMSGNSQIIINTGDGYNYYFGGSSGYIDYCEDIVQGTDPAERYLFSALRLKKIVAPNGNVAEFIYNGSSVDLQYVVCKRMVDCRYSLHSSYFSDSSRKLATTLKNIISPLLTAIKVNGAEVITFNYETKEKQEFAFECFSGAFRSYRQSFSGHPFPINKCLSGVTAHNHSGELTGSISFQHCYTSDVQGCSPKMFLLSVTGRDGTFGFDYNESRTDSRYPPVDCDETDHWGYWRGNHGLLTFTDSASIFSQEESLYDLQSTYRDPQHYYSRYGALTCIHYPTGGSTTIEYEPNAVQRRMDIDLTLDYEYKLHSLDTVWQVGGLRVSKLLNESCGFGSHRDSTEYDYGNSGILLKMPRYVASLCTGVTSYTRMDGRPGLSVETTIRYSTQWCNTGLTYSQSNDFIGYSSVREKYSDGSSKRNDFIDMSDLPDEYLSIGEERMYDNFVCIRYTENDTECISLQDCYPLINDDLRNPAITETLLSDFSGMRGKPEREVLFNADGDTVRIVEYNYSEEQAGTVQCIYNCYSHFVDGSRRFYRQNLDSVAVTEFVGGIPMRHTTSYIYNDIGQVTETHTAKSSHRGDENIYLRFVHETDNLALKSEVSDAVKTRVVGGDEYVTAYSHFDYGVSGLAKPTGLKIYDIETPYLRPGNVFTVPNAGFRQSSFQYNALHRLTRASYPGGAYVQYGWDSDGRHLISRTENGPANETTYQWIDMVGLSQKRTPTYQLEYYEYDGRGRLKRVKNTGGFTVTLFDYFLNND